MTQVRRRWLYVALILVNIPAGLATRWYGSYLPPLVATYGGDVLAASCIFFGMRFMLIRKPLWQVALWAYIVCITIETAQLYRAPWVVRFRDIPLVAVFLGRGFLWSDWVCYAVGVFLGWAISAIADRQQSLVNESNVKHNSYPQSGNLSNINM